jgi:hypothetical protein
LIAPDKAHLASKMGFFVFVIFQALEHHFEMAMPNALPVN